VKPWHGDSNVLIAGKKANDINLCTRGYYSALYALAHTSRDQLRVPELEYQPWLCLLPTSGMCVYCKVKVQLISIQFFWFSI